MIWHSFYKASTTVYSAWKLNNEMISIEYQSKFISKKSKPHYQNSLSLELRFKSGQSIKIPASIGSNSRIEKCLGTNVLILTSQPPPPTPPKKNALLVRCRKNLGSATQTHEKRMSYRFIWTVWYNMRGKNCNPLGNNSILNSAKVLLPPPPPPTHTHTRSISRTARTRLSRSHSQF